LKNKVILGKFNNCKQALEVWIGFQSNLIDYANVKYIVVEEELRENMSDKG